MTNLTKQRFYPYFTGGETEIQGVNLVDEPAYI